MNQWLTLQEVAQELNISVRTIQHYSRQDPEFPQVYRFGHRNSRIEREAFETWKEAKKMN